MSARAVNERRSYDNSLRAEQAEATRTRILEATRRVLVDRGYAGTTMNGVARAARVSRETIYKAFGNKQALVKRLYDVTLVGDEQAAPLSRRPEYQAMVADPTATGTLVRYAGVVRGLYERLGPLLGVLLIAARSGEPELREFGEETDRQRLVGAARVVQQVAAAGGLRADLTEERAVDIVWTVNSPDVNHLLIVSRGWSYDEYEEWLARSLIGGLSA